MEQEFKWKAIRADFDAICRAFPHSTTTEIRMQATYYDTVDRVLCADKIGLRMRMQNEEQYCCMKIHRNSADGSDLHVNEEFECPAHDLAHGLAQLPLFGAPKALCQQLAQAQMVPTCGNDYLRISVLITGAHFSADLTFDEGVLSSGDTIKKFSEIEMELKGGNFEEFCEFGNAISAQFRLEAEPLSKLARALALSQN